jgi:hypothetical protein
MIKFGIKFLLAVALAVPLSAQTYGTPVCTQSKIVTATSSGVTAIIPQTGRVIRICSVVFNVVQSASPANFSLIYGAGNSCPSPTQLTPVYTGVASQTQAYSQSVDQSIAWTAPPGSGVCLSLSANVTSLCMIIFYDVF